MQTATIDPRINDNILPDNAVADMKTYGLRVYISDIYPGYLWRNCTWYKITPDLKFDSLYTRWYGDEFISVGDDSEECQFNGRRIFRKNYEYQSYALGPYKEVRTYYDPKKKVGWHCT